MAVSTDQIVVLSASQMDQKIRRMAYEMYENNYGTNELFLAGICEQGETLAKKLAAILKEISPIEAKVIMVPLDKKNPSNPMPENSIPQNLTNKVVVMVDDVLNTGKTLAYSLKPFLDKKIKKIEVAVLVNRSHTAFPISPQYTGYELSTTMSDRILVKMTGKEKGVYLT
ncbi:MAG: phosphoribosyltransferase [Cyclobacteriaceae bacterium]|nr:phosphoribosyltransferase [Cyclobacteriaceae bacterium]